MPGNSFGEAFRITTAGESHGPANLVIIDGVPAGMALDASDLQPDLDRRRPGQSNLVSQRAEPDRAQILSGVFEGRTTGTSLAILIATEDAKPKDYRDLEAVYRPGHADYGFDARFGHRDHRGGGRASARETVARVAAGAVAKKLLAQVHGIRIHAWTQAIGDAVAPPVDVANLSTAAIDAHPTRCPHPETAQAMADLIEAVRKDRDSVGGIAEACALGVPAGWGAPVFDKLKADLGKAMFSLPAVIGVDYGSGFSGASMRGSQHNDPFIAGPDGAVSTASNRHGGMLGGISTGMPIRMRCAIKPTSSIPREQATVNRSGEAATVRVTGRHDPCLLPRFVPVAEAMIALVLADHMLRRRTVRIDELQ